MPSDHHDHLIDLQSGRVIEFRNEEIEKLQRARRRRSSATIWSGIASNFMPCRATASQGRRRMRLQLRWEFRRRRGLPDFGAGPRDVQRTGQQRDRAPRHGARLVDRRHDAGNRAAAIVDIVVGPAAGAAGRDAPPISTRRRRCATASSTRSWARSRCPGWRSARRDIDRFDADLRSSAGARPQPRQRRRGRRRHLPADPARGRRAARRVLLGRRIRHLARWSPIPARSSSSAAPASTPPIASGRPCSCCGAASPPMSSITTSR